ncbi:MAG: hypothetical protein Q4B27_01270 [Candidatus Saccharibacteria bacterium]|jgi:hypothetical protein|nr:hypothetical protein [Candidatus Saccharibacteria bacterium]
MQYTFSWGSFFIGTLILIVGGCIVVWHRQLSDMFSDDIGSYSRYQMWGLIGCGLGLLVMTNLHDMILRAFLGLFFHFS